MGSDGLITTDFTSAAIHFSLFVLLPDICAALLLQIYVKVTCFEADCLNEVVIYSLEILYMMEAFAMLIDFQPFELLLLEPHFLHENFFAEKI